jgi:transcriptional regulator with XRE-family HTH domain
MTTAQQLGIQVKAARNKAGLSIRGLSALANIPASTIEGYEAGTKIPAENFLRLADALKHHNFKVDGNEFTVIRTGTATPAPAEGEQLRLDFSGEYDYSKASIKIRPGKITVSFDGVRLSANP